MDDFTMRASRPGEAAALAALVQRAYEGYVPLLGRRPAPMDDDFERRVADGQAFVTERAGTLAGLLVLVSEAGVLLLDNIAVDPAFQHAGLGRRMLAWAEAEAARRGMSAMRLYTNERFARNIALYERSGYRETHRLEQDGHRRVFMAKRLAAAGSQPR